MTTSPASTRELLAEMEKLNEQAADLHIWLRTRANSPLQQPWHVSETNEPPPVAANALPAGKRAEPYLWKWRDIAPYLAKVAELCPIEETDRQQLHLMNPGFGHELRIANSIRVAISIYRPGDTAPTHLHTPNASRTILSEHGGYSVVQGERCPASRGDIIFTPNGTWHGHGNDDATPVVWMDVLDWPLLDYLDLIWIRADYQERAVPADVPVGFSREFYGAGGIVPRFTPFDRGAGKHVSPYFHVAGTDIARVLHGMRSLPGDPYRGVTVELRNPITQEPPFPTLSYEARLLTAGEVTRAFRHTASTVFCVISGTGSTIVDGRRFDWEPNDIFVIPNQRWYHHESTAGVDALLYTVSDEPLIRAIGQYCAQGRRGDGQVIELASTGGIGMSTA